MPVPAVCPEWHREDTMNQTQNPYPDAVPLSEVFDPEAFRALALAGYALPDDLPWEELDDSTQED